MKQFRWSTSYVHYCALMNVSAFTPTYLLLRLLAYRLDASMDEDELHDELDQVSERISQAHIKYLGLDRAFS